MALTGPWGSGKTSILSHPLSTAKSQFSGTYTNGRNLRQMTSATPVNDLLIEIERALDARLWFLALMGSLTIPDVCCALESDDGETNASRYRAWFDAYVSQNYSAPHGGEAVFTGADCWRYRCAILHQGVSQPSRSRYSRVVFVDPDNSNYLHRNVFDDILNLDLRTFCLDLIASARQWQVNASQTVTYESNAAKIFRRHPDGIAPAIGGIAVYG